MKNIKLFIGVIMLALQLPLSILAQPGITTNRNVLFLHGLNGDNTDWQPFVSRFSTFGSDARRMNSFNQSYTSTGGLSNITSSVSTSGSGVSSIAICHSMGGVVARRLDKNSNGSLVGGIVTVGSPLDGAPIANALTDGRATYAVSNAVSLMSRGPLATLGFISPLITFTGNSLGALYLPDLVNVALNVNRFGGSATVNDLKVGGSGIEQDKASTPTSTPKISIWGNEESPIHWNIFGTSIGENVAQRADNFSKYYELSFYAHLSIACANFWNPAGWWSHWAAGEWYLGYNWISNDSERIWNNLIGSDMVGTQCFSYQSQYCYFPDERCDDTPGQWQFCQVGCIPTTGNTCVQVHSNGLSDAFIPFVSQRGEGSNSWRVRNANGNISAAVVKIEALGVNHLEELDAGNGEMQRAFSRIFLAEPSSGIAPVFQINPR
jgi:pimeloyl-ACP methyl ester carboxylesterase